MAKARSWNLRAFRATPTIFRCNPPAVSPGEAQSSRPVEPTIDHRLYACARCGRLVQLCTRCDRGNLYCFQGCADQARRDSLGRAGRRYQDTPAGRANHAARQQRYLQRKDAKMTHQGSPEAPEPTSSTPPMTEHPTGMETPCDPSQAQPQQAAPSPATAPAPQHPLPRRPPRCDHCGAPLGPFARRRFLRRHRRPRPPS